MFKLLKKHFRYSAPGVPALSGWSFWGWESFLGAAPAGEPTMLATWAFYTGVACTGAIAGIVWADVSRKNSPARKWWAMRGSPLRLKSHKCVAANQTDCQAGQKLLNYGVYVENTKKDAVSNVMVKLRLNTCQEADVVEYCYQIERIVGHEHIFVPCIEFLTNDDGSLSQYRVLEDANGQSTQWCQYNQELEIYACLASDVQPINCPIQRPCLNSLPSMTA